MDKHPLMKVLQAARNKLITLEAQLPVPAPAGVKDFDRQWARVRVALRDTKDIYRLTEFLHEIYKNIVVPNHSGDLIAIQATPSVHPRPIEESPPGTTEHEQTPHLASLWGGDLDVSAIPAIADEPTDARTWHQIAIYADARSNIESEITQCLPPDYQHYQLAHLNYAVLHGTAEMILLLHEPADCYASDTHACSRPPAAAPDGEIEPAAGQPRVVINKNVSLRQLGPLTQHPLLRIRVRAQDQPGAFLNIMEAIGKFLEEDVTSYHAGELEYLLRAIPGLHRPGRRWPPGPPPARHHPRPATLEQQQNRTDGPRGERERRLACGDQGKGRRSEKSGQ